jgi:RND family efflux transporter MFP subunit
MNKIVNILVLLVVTLSISSCNEESEKTKEIIRPVKVLLIGNSESTSLRVFPGVTLASNETTLAFQVPGQIIKFPVLEGDRILQDSIIAELDPVKYQEKVNETHAKLIRDKSNYERASVLVKDGHLSLVDYDKVKSAFLMSQAEYNTAKNDLDRTKLLSPFYGVVAKKMVKNYEYVTAKQPIILLQDVDTIDIEINVPENVVVSLKAHQADQENMFATYDAIPNQQFKLILKEYSSQADAQTQTFRIVFTMKRPSGFNILPGMTVSVHASLGNASAVNFYIVPSSAVFQDETNKPAIWIVDQKSRVVHKANVTVSTLSSDKIRILSGVKPGDMIVISGVHFLSEGQEVTILK